MREPCFRPGTSYPIRPLKSTWLAALPITVLAANAIAPNVSFFITYLLPIDLASILSISHYLSLALPGQTVLRRRRITPKPTRAEPSSARDAGSGVGVELGVTACSV